MNYTPLDTVDDINDEMDFPKAFSGSHKETEPMGKNLAVETIDAAQEQQPEKGIEDEQQYITEKKVELEISEDLRTIGLQTADPGKFPTIENVTLPVSDDKVIIWQKAPITSPRRWLSTLATYILSGAHLTLRVVHGHVVRVFRR